MAAPLPKQIPARPTSYRNGNGPTLRIPARLPISRIITLADVPEKIKPYVFHGVELNYRSDAEWVPGTCPLCYKDSHFYVKKETGQFKCQRCNADGNAYTFLDLLWQHCSQNGNANRLNALADNRGVSVESLEALDVVFNQTTQEFIVPGHNTKGVIANLYRCVVSEVDGKQRIRMMPTPGCKIQPMGINHLRQYQDSYKTIWLTEGLWDAAALFDTLQAEGSSDEGLVAAPSAGNVQADWFQWFTGKRLRIAFDNDHPKLFPDDHDKAGELMMNRGQPVRPGWDGMTRVAKLLNNASKQPASVEILHWNKDGGHNPELPDGYDLRDHLTGLIPPAELPGMVLPGVDGLRAMMAPTTLSSPQKNEAPQASTVKPIPCTSFEELMGHYEQAFHMTQTIRDTVAVMLAVILSTESEPINHLWLRVIGPPGSLKSTLAEAVSAAREYVNPKSVLTGFHSGFIDPSGDGQSSSLIPQFNKRTAVIKDADTLSNSPNRDQILRELRDMYDGTSRSTYRNRTGDEFEDIRISFILCGTDDLRNLNRTFLGERFIDCEIVSRGEDTAPYLSRVVDSTYDALVAGFKNADAPEDSEEQHSPTFIKSVTYGFIDYLKKNYKSWPPPRASQNAKELFKAMGRLVAKIRARSSKDADVSYRPRTELGTRPGAQFTKLAFFLALVLQKDEIDDEVIRIDRKVAHDTCVSFNFDIVEQLAAAGEEGMYFRQLVHTIPTSETQLRRIIGEMHEFGLVQKKSVANNSGQRGRDAHVWMLSAEMLELWHTVFGSPAIAGPCSYCGAADHWRPDCPKIPQDHPEVLKRTPPAGSGLALNGSVPNGHKIKNTAPKPNAKGRSNARAKSQGR
jgi:hypothetical protein